MIERVSDKNKQSEKIKRGSLVEYVSPSKKVRSVTAGIVTGFRRIMNQEYATILVAMGEERPGGRAVVPRSLVQSCLPQQRQLVLFILKKQVLEAGVPLGPRSRLLLGEALKELKED